MALKIGSNQRARRGGSRSSGRKNERRQDNLEVREQFHLIRKLALDVSEQSTVDDCLWHVVQTVVDGLDVESCCIYLFDEDRSTLIQRATQGPDNPSGRQSLIPVRVPVGSGIVGEVAQTGEPMLSTATDGAVSAHRRKRYRARLVVPLLHSSGTVGVIDCQAQSKDAFAPWHTDLLSTVAGVVSDRIAHRLTLDRLASIAGELEETRAALRVGEERYRVLYDEHPSMFVMLDSLGVIKVANRFALKELGFEERELVSRPVSDLYKDENSATIMARITQCLESPHKLHRFESDLLRKSGEVMRVRETARVIDFDGDVNTILVVIEDITDTYNLSKELEFQATHDSLTGLCNRREFERRLNGALASSRASNTDHAICYIDLDQFKLINDTCGHRAGDQLLTELSKLFNSRIRQSDTVARLGGDEFGILMEACPLGNAQRVAESLRKSVEEFRFEWDEQQFSTGVSVGLVAMTPHTQSVGEAMAYADAACYAAKEAGRNRLHVYHMEDEEMIKRDQEMRWVSRIERALEIDNFRLYAQPIVPIKSNVGKVKAYEILLRMIGDDGEIILPDGFLPAAERYGLATRVDRWVLDHTVEWLAENKDEIEGVNMISVNLSARTVCDESFLDFAKLILQKSVIDPAIICFEITETTAMSNIGRATRFISELQDIGCQFALDDFGSGFSSLAHVRNLPVDLLKIDGSLIRDVLEDPVDLALVRSISDIGHMLGKKTIAEFVATDELLDAMSEAGLDFVQGSVVGDAMPIGQILPTRLQLID